MKKNPFGWLMMWLALVFGVVFSFSSCNNKVENPQPTDKGTTLLAPDLYLLDQWEKEVAMNEDFYGQLDSLAQASAIPGEQLTAKLAQFKKDRIALYKVNGELADWRARIVGPLGGVVLPPKPPPPPPPIIDWENLLTRQTIPVDRNGPLVLYFPPSLDGGNFQVSITQGQQTIPGTQTVLSGGVIKVEFNAGSFTSGNMTINLPGFNGRPPVNLSALVNN
jgi:hypothetical protein